MVYISYINEAYRDKSLENRLMIDVTGFRDKDTVRALNVYNRKMEELKLSSLQKFLLSHIGFARIGKRRYPDWADEIPFYVYRCRLQKEEFFVDYIHGYNNRLDC